MASTKPLPTTQHAPLKTYGIIAYTLFGPAIRTYDDWNDAQRDYHIAQSANIPVYLIWIVARNDKSKER